MSGLTLTDTKIVLEGSSPWTKNHFFVYVKFHSEISTLVLLCLYLNPLS